MLPSNLTSQLPAHLKHDQIEDHLGLQASLGGGYGETFLIQHEEGLLILGRESMIDPPILAALDPAQPPRIDHVDYQDVVRVTTIDGQTYVLPLSEWDRKDALAFLERLCTKQNAWEQLVGVLRLRLEHTLDETTRYELIFTIAQLLDHQLERDDEAFLLYQEVVEARPEHSGAFEALERFFVFGVHPAEIGPILEKTYRIRGDFEKLAEHLLLMAKESDIAGQYARLMEAAELFAETLKDASRAIEIYGQALCAKPTEPDPMDQLEALASVTGDWSEVAQVLWNGLQQLEGGAERRELLWRIGRIFEEQLDDSDKAETYFKHVIKIDKTDQPALEALEGIYTRTEDWEKLGGILELRIEATDVLEEKVEILHRLGEVEATLIDDPYTAAIRFETILELDASNERALSSLEPLYLELEKWEPLFDVLERWAALVSPDQSVPLLTQMAELCCEQLDRREDGKALYERILTVDPNHFPTLLALSAMAEEDERWSELAVLFERMVDLTRSDDDRIVLYRQLATIHSDRLDSLARAMDYLRQALTLAPTDLELLRALKKGYGKLGYQNGLVQTAEQMLSVDVPPEERLSLCLELARIYTAEPGDSVKAIQAWNRVLKQAPHNIEALEQLEQLHTQRKEWEHVVSVLNGRLGLAAETGSKVELMHRLAGVYEVKLQNMDKALAIFSQIIDVAPGDLGAFKRLENLFELKDDFLGLVQLLIKRSETCQDQSERVDLIHRAAVVAETRTRQPELAFKLLLSVAQNVSLEASMASDLARLALKAHAWRELINHYQHWAETRDSVRTEAATHGLTVAARALTKPGVPNELAANVLEQIGDVFENTLGNSKRAVQCHIEALKQFPEHISSHEKLRRLYAKNGQWSAVARQLERMVNLESFRPIRRNLYRQLHSVYKDKLKARENADQAWRTLQALDLRRRVKALLILLAIIAAGAGAFWVLSWLD